MNNLTSNETLKPPTDNHMHQFDLAENRAVLDDVLICGQQDLELAHPQFALQIATLHGVVFVQDHLHRWCPLCELARPVGHPRQGHDDEVRPELFLRLNKECEERDGLDGFAQNLHTCKRRLRYDDVFAHHSSARRLKSLQALELIVLELTSDENQTAASRPSLRYDAPQRSSPL